VRGALFAIEQPRIGAALAHDLFGHRTARVVEQGVGGVDGFAQCRNQFAVGGDRGSGKRHGWASGDLISTDPA